MDVFVIVDQKDEYCVCSEIPALKAEVVELLFA